MSDVLQQRAERREHLWRELTAEYEARFPASRRFQQRAAGSMVDGGSHTARLFPPFPIWTVEARGAYVTDLDGHAILDFWQGHLANVLGHNPPVVTEALAEALRQGRGLQTGMQETWEAELAELLCRLTGAERIRFTTSGSLATMYAILVARAFTGRELVLKVGGGWHGAQPWGLKGVHFGARGYAELESEGLPAEFPGQVLVTRYNDPAALEETFRAHGDHIAAFIVEPFIGGGGLTAGRPDYLRLARQLTERYGALLIFDEIIDGFRFCAGTLASLYGVRPDLTTLGKAIGGGMPVAAVAGRADVLRIAGKAGKEGGRRAMFEGGTYSAHPLSMLAGRTMVQYLAEHAGEIYPALADKGARLRQAAQSAFAAEGIVVHPSGALPAGMAGSSLMSLHFPHQPAAPDDRPDALNDPTRYDVDLKERLAKVAFLLEGVYVIHAGGALSAAHTLDDVARMEAACAAVARRFARAGL